MRRAGLVVRTVRRLHRKPSGARQRPEGGGASDAGAGSGGDGDTEEGSVIEEVEEEMVCKVDPHDVAEAEDLLEAYFMQVGLVCACGWCRGGSLKHLSDFEFEFLCV